MARTLGEADLGNAASGATLAFSIPAAKGFSADAALDQEMKRVAAWESIEISGMTTEENLVPSGLYTLQVEIAFRSKKTTQVTLDFTLSKGAKQLSQTSLSFSGKDGDLGRAVVFAEIA